MLIRLVIATLLAAAVPALAAPSLKIVVLPVSTGGYLPRRAMWQSEFSLRVTEEVKKAKHAQVPSGPLSTAEESCREVACAEALAARTHADAIIGARVMSNDKVPPSYHIEVWMYDRAQPSLIQKRDQLCGPCSESNAAEMVTQLAREVIEGKGKPAIVAVPATTPSPESSANPAIVATSSDGTKEHSHRRLIFKATGFASLAVAVAGLGLMIAGAVKHGEYENAARSVQTDAIPAIGLGAAGFGLFGAASGVLLWKGFSK